MAGQGPRGAWMLAPSRRRGAGARPLHKVHPDPRAVAVSHNVRNLEKLEAAAWRYRHAATGAREEGFACGGCRERWGWNDSLGTPLGPPRVEAFRCCDKE